MLPDLVGKLLEVVLHTANRFYVPSHTVLGLALYGYVASFAFEERLRPKAWLALWLGGCLHILVDLFKDTMGSASSALFLFPLAVEPFEFGLYDPIHAIWTLPIALASVAAWEALARTKGNHVWE